ncbi:MAG: Abi family protein [Deltaproteobacteria bacterium]
MVRKYRRELQTQEVTEIFIRHFDAYEEELPPVWVICEIMTLGQLSKWYANLRHGSDRNIIANVYGIDEVNIVACKLSAR